MPFKGYKQTEEHKRKISNSKLKDKNSKGGRYINSAGYIYIYYPDHPRAINRRIYEHILVVEKILGRYLKPEERVHHIDGDKVNNNPENLFVCENISKHKTIHNKYGRETMILYKLGIIKFNKLKREYYLNKEKIKND